jgi:hypothetical protein
MFRRGIITSILLDYVNSVPAERVAQIHIAGHSQFQKYTLDTHDHPVIDPVWQLYERAIERCGLYGDAVGVGRSIFLRLTKFMPRHLKANGYVPAKVVA